MYRKHAVLTGNCKSEIDLNWISTRCKNPKSLTGTLNTLTHLECKKRILEGFSPNDNLRIKDKGLTPKVSFIWELHSICWDSQLGSVNTCDIALFPMCIGIGRWKCHRAEVKLMMLKCSIHHTKFLQSKHYLTWNIIYFFNLQFSLRQIVLQLLF